MASVPSPPPPALTIGIDARAASEVKAGRGRVVRELLRGLAAAEDPHRYVCYARTAWDEPLGDRFSWRLIGARDPLWHALTALRAGRECDVFLATNSYLSVILTRVPAVAIVYDLVTFDPAMAPSRRSAVIERLTLGTAVRRARAFVCISQATSEALTTHFPAAAGRITVAPLGVAPALSAPAAVELEALPEPGFVLAVGTLEPRKNLPRLVAAYGALDPNLQAAHRLVVVGASGWSTGPTVAALRSLGDRCLTLGHVSDAALAELYRRCAVFCYPSLGEGFGLPVLEAMAAGAPVLTSSLSSLPEVGGQAAEYVDPHQVASIAAGLDRVLGDPALRERLSCAGRRRAGEFSWQQFAERTLAVLQAAASSRS
ncbi:MAG: glycosyltransferase family 1 protein [Solirubrobacteraceae bacterium]